MFAHEAYDALVVGARCAGAATAMLMARKGMRVLVIDRGGYGTDTISTHALMRGGVLQLHRWGVLPRLQEAGTPPVRETTFHYGDEAITVPIKPSHGVDALYAPRRTLLDSTLDRCGARSRCNCAAWPHARRSHASFGRTRHAARRVLRADGNTMQIEADLVVGADGAGSRRCAACGARRHSMKRDTPPPSSLATFAASSCTGYHWWYRPGIGVGAIPTNGGRHCVFAAMSPERLRNGPSA